MAKFTKEKKRGAPTISTASLPDIVFMLLFFFMVATVIRQAELKIQLQVPKATEVEKLQKKSLVSYIYIGQPQKGFQDKYGTQPRIQLNDAFANLGDIKEFVTSERQSLSESERPKMIISLKVDKKVNMGIVTDVKQELRKASALKINYAATRAEQVY